MAEPLARNTVPRRVRVNTAGVKDERRKPNVPGRWIFVGDFFGPDDPSNLPLDTTFNSPPWLNSFYYISPVAFRHGLDGQTDMIGIYDLTLGAVSGGTAFMMPLQWAVNTPFAAHFPVELEPDVWTIAIQKCDLNDTVGNEVPIKIYWPIVATPYP